MIKDNPLSERFKDTIEEAGDESDPNGVEDSTLSQKSENVTEEAVEDT